MRSMCDIFRITVCLNRGSICALYIASIIIRIRHFAILLVDCVGIHISVSHSLTLKRLLFWSYIKDQNGPFRPGDPFDAITARKRT